ncbi:hypothetical protein ATANTOWER_000385 [Ataeniobius toweri]|uniref:Uncharacterized protein n=1 Tax=Ataeniobius toweri TaxID=208326 RepID=A0ABU7BCQ3_9TELE|nr:hypothetical protein [Ataeniobius toweri]
MSLALDLDPVSVPGFLSLPSPWFYLPEPTCLSFLPGLPVLAQSPVKWPVPAFLVLAAASTHWSVSLGVSAIRHRSVGHSRMNILGWLLIDHLPAEEPFPGSLSYKDPEKWFLGCDWWLPVFLFPRLKFWVFSPGLNGLSLILANPLFSVSLGNISGSG